MARKPPCEARGHVLDVLVHSPDLWNDQTTGYRPPPPAAPHKLDLESARDHLVSVTVSPRGGRDNLRGDRIRGDREAGQTSAGYPDTG